jgi:hypothetical protein
MATASRTYQPISVNDPATWTEVGDSATLTFAGYSTDNGGCLEFTSAGAITNQPERGRHGDLSWESLFGIPVGSVVSDIQITNWKEASWTTPAITSRQVRLRFVDVSGVTICSAGELFDTGLGIPTSSGGTPVVMGAGTSRAVDASFQASATTVRLEVQLTATTTGALDLEQQLVEVTITYGSAPVGAVTDSFQ